MAGRGASQIRQRGEPAATLPRGKLGRRGNPRNASHSRACGDPLKNGMQAWLTASLKSSKRRLGAAPLKNGMQAWLTAIAAVLVEAGFSRSEAARRSEGALVQIQGALVVSRCLQSEEPFQRTLRGLPSTLMGQYSETP